MLKNARDDANFANRAAIDQPRCPAP
jgi:hypothetical protein